MTTTYAAIVLAGGHSRRMNVPDKTRLELDGRPLLDRVLAACGTDAVVVVGEPRPTARPVVWAREDPPGGGPAAALAAGLRHVDAPTTVVLAGDLPFLTADVVTRLVAAVTVDGAVLVDDGGREQWLCSAWRTAALRDVPLVAGGSLRTAVGALTFARVASAPADRPPWFDCDTPDDLRRAEEQLT